MRTEFGAERSSCGCEDCKRNCRFMPGFLIPADLTRMVPEGVDAFEWAKKNLLASPGALVLYKGEPYRLPTLVPAVKRDGTCINLRDDGTCAIHAASPFGCAFFSCQSVDPAASNLSMQGLSAVQADRVANGTYTLIWKYLWRRWKRQQRPDILRAKMRGEQ